MHKIGIAFGGGGARGIAHIGVLRTLRARDDLIPQIIAGTSAGSIIASVFAAGVPQARIEAEIRNFEWFRDVVSVHDTLKRLVESKRAGLVSNERLETTVNELIGNRGFDQLARDLAVVAADIDTKERVIFTGKRIASRLSYRHLTEFLPAPEEMKPGAATVVISDLDNVGKAVAASCAIPGLFQPVIVGDRRLVDGALFDQVPVDVVRAMGASPVIGVSLSLAMSADKPSGLTGMMSTMIGMLGLQQLRKSLDLADIGFQIPGIEKKSLFDTHQIELIDEGEAVMNRLIPELERLMHPSIFSPIARPR